LKPPYWLLTFLIVFISCDKAKNQNTIIVAHQGVDTLFTMKVIGSDEGGWGYEIYRNNKRLINQTTIPAVGGNKKFVSYEQANKVGDLVLKKLSKRDGLPTIFIKELDSLKISY